MKVSGSGSVARAVGSDEDAGGCTRLACCPWRTVDDGMPAITYVWSRGLAGEVGRRIPGDVAGLRSAGKTSEPGAAVDEVGDAVASAGKGFLQEFMGRSPSGAREEKHAARLQVRPETI